VVASCIPGATLTKAGDNGAYQGTMRIKFGPTVAQFRGEAKLAYDHGARRCSIEGRGIDGRGASRANASGVVEASGTDTTVLKVESNFNVTGPLETFAQDRIKPGCRGCCILHQHPTLPRGQRTRWGSGLTQQYGCRVRVHVAEVAGQRGVGELVYCSSHLNPGRSSADQDKRQQASAYPRVCNGFRCFEGEQQTAGDQGGVVDRFETGSQSRPLAVTERGVSRPGRED
jgi:carbon monoxide dehydrogenase subunit G